MRRGPAALLAALAATVASALFAAPSHAGALTPVDPASPGTEDMRTAYVIAIVVAVVLLVAVHAGLGAAVSRFRARRGARPSGRAPRRGLQGRIAAVLAVLALGLFAVGTVLAEGARTVQPAGPDGLLASASRTAQASLEGLPPAPPGPPAGGAAGTAPGMPPEGRPLRIEAVGQRWLWRFVYPGGRPGDEIFTYNELVVPEDTPVVLDLGSTDVVHTFWVPALTGAIDAVPGSINHTWFKADEPGVHRGQAATFSGTGFSTMDTTVRVVAVPEYLSFVEQLREDLDEAQAAVAMQQSEQAGTEAGGGTE